MESNNMVIIVSKYYVEIFCLEFAKSTDGVTEVLINLNVETHSACVYQIIRKITLKNTLKNHIAQPKYLPF